jgi:hypothetical protein
LTDNLRDRIAAVLYEAVRDKCDGYVADVIAAGQPIDPLADEVLVDGLLEFPALADAVIEALKLRQESCVRYTYAPRFSNRGLDACDDCGEPCIHNQESATALLEKLNSRDRRFKPEPVTRYVTEWVSDT